MTVRIAEAERPVAVMKQPAAGRPQAESIALAKAYEAELGYAAVPDAGFAKKPIRDVRGE